MPERWRFEWWAIVGVPRRGLGWYGSLTPLLIFIGLIGVFNGEWLLGGAIIAATLLLAELYNYVRSKWFP